MIRFLTVVGFVQFFVVCFLGNYFMLCILCTYELFYLLHTYKYLTRDFDISFAVLFRVISLRRNMIPYDDPIDVYILVS